jgi:hypothetical protein
MQEVLIPPLSPNGGEGWGEGEVNHLPLPVNKYVAEFMKQCTQLGQNAGNKQYNFQDQGNRRPACALVLRRLKPAATEKNIPRARQALDLSHLISP